MKKATAFALLGGNARAVAELLGMTRQAVHQWPDELPRRLADRVLAARVRMEWADALRVRRAPPDAAASLVLDALALPDAE